jgi:hypothetical protein
VSDSIILYCGIAAFSLLLVGIALTMYEFRKMYPHAAKVEAVRSPKPQGG